jgi:hypothetical protein
MTTARTHFPFRVDTWTPDGESIVEHVVASASSRSRGCGLLRARRWALAKAKS